MQLLIEPRELGDPTVQALVAEVQIKRMYVREGARRRGIARALLGALERSATEAGRRRIVLETGTAQPEALGLYRAAGYQSLDTRYGRYAESSTSVYLAKSLR